MSPSLTAHCPTAIYFSSPRRESSTVPTANKTVLITGANTGCAFGFGVLGVGDQEFTGPGERVGMPSGVD